MEEDCLLCDPQTVFDNTGNPKGEQESMKISGVIERGAGKGAHFTQVEWVVKQCEHKLNMTPFPGTLNVRINDETAHRLADFLRISDIELVPDDPSFCVAHVKKVTVNGIVAAVVLPSEDVRIHDNRTIELIASCNLKKRLGLDDGDTVTISDEWNKNADGTQFDQQDSMDIYREIFEFAASAGALEGYVYKRNNLATNELDDWVQNLVKQYHDFPEKAKTHFQTSLDRTMGRATHSLSAILGPKHQHVLSLKSLITGDIPASSHDFNREKEEKSRKYRH